MVGWLGGGWWLDGWAVAGGWMVGRWLVVGWWLLVGWLGGGWWFDHGSGFIHISSNLTRRLDPILLAATS